MLLKLRPSLPLSLLMALFLLTLVSACQPTSGDAIKATAGDDPGTLEEKVIYGTDGRQDLFQAEL